MRTRPFAGAHSYCRDGRPMTPVAEFRRLFQLEPDLVRGGRQDIRQGERDASERSQRAAQAEQVPLVGEQHRVDLDGPVNPEEPRTRNDRPCDQQLQANDFLLPPDAVIALAECSIDASLICARFGAVGKTVFGQVHSLRCTAREMRGLRRIILPLGSKENAGRHQSEVCRGPPLCCERAQNASAAVRSRRARHRQARPGRKRTWRRRRSDWRSQLPTLHRIGRLYAER